MENSERVTVEFGAPTRQYFTEKDDDSEGSSDHEGANDHKEDNDEVECKVSLNALIFHVPALRNQFSGDSFRKGSTLDLTTFSLEAGQAFINLVTMMSKEDENPGFHETVRHSWRALPIIAKYCCDKLHDFVYDMVLNCPWREGCISDNNFAWAVLEYDLCFPPGTEIRRPGFPTQIMLNMVVFNLAKPLEAKLKDGKPVSFKSCPPNRIHRVDGNGKYLNIDGIPIDLKLLKFGKLSNELLVELSTLLTAFV